jgi:hypothetical protein
MSNPLLATAPSTQVSPKYQFFNSQALIEAVEASTPYRFEKYMKQSRGKNAATGKHLIFFSIPMAMYEIPVARPQLVILNSHDGTCALRIMLAMHVYACKNGLITTAGTLADARVRHTAPFETVLQALEQVTAQIPTLLDTVQCMVNTRMLGYTAKIAQVLELRGIARINGPTTLLSPVYRRPEQREDTVWHVFNQAQEQLLRTGFTYTDETGKLRTARGIRSVSETVRLNTELWNLFTKGVAA